jgi:vacuolar-type H+-ATPase subunit I/STV1
MLPRELAAAERKAMPNLLWLIAALCVIMWLFGFALHFTLGGLIHVLLAVAVISVLFRIILGHRVA